MNRAAWRQFALLVALALGVRLAGAVYWQARLDRQGSRFEFGDSESYWTLGRAIAQGGPYRYGPEGAQIFRAPGYPLLLAPIFLAAGGQPNVLWARAEGAILGTLAVGGVWWLARGLFDGRAGLIAGAVAAVYPGAVVLSGLVLSEAAFCPLMLLQSALWTIAWRAQSPRRAMLLALVAGVAAGAATLVRPSWLLFTPFAVAVGLVIGGRGMQTTCAAHWPEFGPPSVLRGRWRHLWIGAWMIAGLILAMMPWWVRNARVSGRFVPTTLQVGASLYDGLNPQATGASNMDLVPDSVRQLRRQAATGQLPRDVALEVELDRRFRSAAWAFARDNPAAVARLAGVKLLRMWNVWPNEASLSRWPVRAAVVLSYLPVLALAVIGAGRTVCRGWPYGLCWLPAVYLTMLHVVFVSSIRYRQPAMLGLMVLAAGVAGSWKKAGGPRAEDR